MRGALNSPLLEVAHRGRSQRPREMPVESRPRNANSVGKRVTRPREVGVLMDQRMSIPGHTIETQTDCAIRSRSAPPLSARSLQVDEEQFRQHSGRGFRAGLAIRSFRVEHVKQRQERGVILAPQHHWGGEGSETGAEGGTTRAVDDRHQPRPHRAESDTHERSCRRRMLRRALVTRSHATRRIRAEAVATPARHPQHVARDQELRFAPRPAHPGLTLEERVKPRSALRIDSNAPAAARFGANDDGAMQTDDFDIIARSARGLCRQERHVDPNQALTAGIP